MNEEKYTTLEQSKRLAEIGFSAEADGFYTTDRDGEQLYSALNKPNLIDMSTFSIGCCAGSYAAEDIKHWTKAFRLDTLLLELPEITFNEDRYPFFRSIQMTLEMQDLMLLLLESKGKEAIAATVSLLELLKSEEPTK
jgi:hypothetical protein